MDVTDYFRMINGFGWEFYILDEPVLAYWAIFQWHGYSEKAVARANENAAQ